MIPTKLQENFIYSYEENFFIKAFMYSYNCFLFARKNFFYRSVPEQSAYFVKKIQKIC